MSDRPDIRTLWGYCRTIPEGLTQAEVNSLIDDVSALQDTYETEIVRLRKALGEQTAKNQTLVNRVHNLERSRSRWRQQAEAK